MERDALQLISSWGFDSYVEIFEKNKIDLSSLQLLNFESLATLIPAVGDRIKFLSKLDDFRNNREVVVNWESIDYIDFDAGSVDPETPKVLGSVEPQQSTEHRGTKRSASSSPSRVRIEQASKVFGSVDPPQCTEHRGNQRSASPSRVRIEQASKESTNSVREYLKCPKGERVLTNYFGTARQPKPPERQSLDVTHQNLLVELIISNELHTSNTEISSARLLQLAENIENIFPNENKDIYFIPYSSSKINGSVVKRHCAQGKLWWKYTNLCKTLIKENQLLPSVEVSSLSGILHWLEGQTDITEQLRNKWKQTCELRFSQLLQDQINSKTIIKRSGVCLIKTYMNKYPVLRQPTGYRLLEQDFINRYPQCENKLFDKWCEFRRKVLRLAGEESPTEDYSEARIIFAFCHLVTALQKSKRVSKNWVANSAEIVEGFILHVKVVDSLHSDIERIVDRANANKLQVSPFAVVVGPDLQKITDSYIHVDGVLFRVSSPLHAVDLTFKAIHALHAVYQKQSTAIWLLFQRVVYELTTQWDQTCSVVEGLLHKLNSLELH